MENLSREHTKKTDMKYIIHLMLFIIYTIMHLSFFSDILNKAAGNKEISTGIFFVIAGIWGYCINNMFFRIHMFRENPRLFNCILIVFGFALVINIIAK